MATVRPFRAVRPGKAFAEKVISLPYDVMNREEAARMAAGNPYSFLHICRSEIDLPETTDPYAPEVYRQAADTIGRFLSEGVFFQDGKPMLYVYEQEMDGRVQRGIVGCVSVDEYQEGLIKKHEFTRVEKEQDRIRHFDVCGANTEPVFLTYRETPRLAAALESAMAGLEPEYDFVAGDGIGHRLWAIGDEKDIAGLTEGFRAVPALYIADGHHRSASACKVGLRRREACPDYTGEEEFNYFMAVIFPDHQLRIFDYNRVVKDLNGLSAEGFLKAVEEAGFQVEAVGTEPLRPAKKHEFSMILDGIWYRLSAGGSIIPEDPIGSLDVSILQDRILGPVLGILDPRTDKRIDFIGGIRGLGEIRRRTETDMKTGFAVYPVEIEDLLRVADSGMVMPPKSTWFEPKLGSGLFLHLL